jgi:hypothetical protein
LNRLAWLPRCVSLLLCAGSVLAQPAPAVQPEVGRPLQSAVAAIKAGHPGVALARAREAQAVPGKSAYEEYLVRRVTGQAHEAAGDHAAAAASLEEAASSPGAPPGERPPLLAAAAGHYYSARQYANAASIAARYFAQGGEQPSVRSIRLQSLYLAGDYAAAWREISAEIRAQEAAGRKPPEKELQMLASAAQRAKDDAAYAQALEKLLRHYPKREYWMSALQDLGARPDFDERLSVHAQRLRLEVGAMRGATDYLDLAQRLLLDGFASEAARVMDKGYAAGILGKGPEAPRHARLKALIASKSGEEPAARSEGPLNEAQLIAGFRYSVSGERERAIGAFRNVPGDGAAAALARLWLVHLGATAEPAARRK